MSGVRMGGLPAVVLVAVLGCGGTAPPAETPATRTQATTATRRTARRACGGKRLRVSFYDAKQGLAALVTLPDGKHILVDTGEAADRAGCGQPCRDAHAHLMERLAADLDGAPIDLLWITHPHSDHIGGAVDVIDRFTVAAYADNGRDADARQIKATHDALAARGVTATVIEPGETTVPLATGEDVELTAVVPPAWLPACKDNRNDCSILLRIDYCRSSILFAGDAEDDEEAQLTDLAPATLLQVGHHGSNTSSSAPFLDRVAPHYAVISAGAAGEGTNRTYCHPFASTVEHLTAALGGAGAATVHAFESRRTGAPDIKCKGSSDADWVDVPASDQLWATVRDGDVVLTTTGNGTFEKQ